MAVDLMFAAVYLVLASRLTTSLGFGLVILVLVSDMQRPWRVPSVAQSVVKHCQVLGGIQSFCSFVRCCTLSLDAAGNFSRLVGPPVH